MDKNKKVREPFFGARVANTVLGLVILALLILILFQEGGNWVMEAVVFLLVAIENFIVATIKFSEQKKIRGNVYAVLCAIFALTAILKAGYHWIFV